eukprot:COSAG01_NODE_35046_length_538_cov_0.560364_1_plen_56_part_00
MRKLTSSDIKELKLLKHYRIIRKWACKTCNLNDAADGSAKGNVAKTFEIAAPIKK